ncbi:hypothetical protein R1flu_016208 [Riccia fluitans]|uniref:Uncharacterized protein n=1 Tax=Riccia fluitans TaxID=41844 RepID=A0ABD1YQ16_9MARC
MARQAWRRSGSPRCRGAGQDMGKQPKMQPGLGRAIRPGEVGRAGQAGWIGQPDTAWQRRAGLDLGWARQAAWDKPRSMQPRPC